LPEEVTQAKIDDARDKLEQARQKLVEVSGQRTELEILKAQAPQLLEELRLLKAQESRLRLNISPIEQRIKELQTQLATETDPNTIQSLNQEIQQRINDPNYVKYQLIQSQIQIIESDLAKIDSLTKIVTEAQSKFDQRKQEYEELLRRQASSQTSQERARFEAELQRKKLELHDLEAQIIAERIRYASDIIAIPAEAAKEFFNEALGEAANYYKEEAKKAAEKEEAEKKRSEEQAIEKLGRSLGRKEKRKGGENVPIPDKKQARRLLTLLFQPSGLQGFINEVANNQRTLMSYGLTQEEAGAILAKKSDPEFVKTVGQNLAKKVLCDYLLAGGRLSRDDIFAIADTDWGKSIIEDGLKLSEEQKKFLESQLGKGVLTTLDEIKGGKTTGEWLRSNWWKIAGIIALLMLFGLIGPSVAQSIPGPLSRG
jgi:predicted  nucleic acid-binding Zn-ribbon protein